MDIGFIFFSVNLTISEIDALLFPKKFGNEKNEFNALLDKIKLSQSLRNFFTLSQPLLSLRIREMLQTRLIESIDTPKSAIFE